MRKNISITISLISVLVLFFSTSPNLFALVETGGIGIKIGQLYDYTTKKENRRGSIVVLDVFKGSVADKHGIQKGDVILKVDDLITKGNDFKDILENHLRGSADTDVTLIIWRPSIKEKITIKLTREPTAY